MKKLIQGIVEFRQKFRDSYQKSYGQLAQRQSPDSFFVACCDSRVVPNTFASTNPGDLFVLRNVGNLIPPLSHHHSPQENYSHLGFSDEAPAAALEFAVLNLNVSDIIICGHSDCGAMRALLGGRGNLAANHLSRWLRHGDTALEWLKKGKMLSPSLTPLNQLSQLNVLLQMEHVKSYPFIQERLKKGTLGLHGWWFDLALADVFTYDELQEAFVLIEENWAQQFLSSFKKG